MADSSGLPSDEADAVASALASLEGCSLAVERLHEMCCEPGRSPRLAAVENDLGRITALVLDLSEDEELSDAIVELIESVGAKVGELQVGCCAPARMPLYADTLVGLTNTQLAVNLHVGRGH